MATSNILACTDGSIYAPSVVAHAAWAAQQLSASVQVLHLLNPHHEDPLKTDLSGSMGFNARQHLLEELVELEAAQAKLAVKRGAAILEDAEAQLDEAGVADIQTKQKHGTLSDSIAASERDADLVVLGKRGRNADFETGHLGSNLERVIRSCQHPVLVAAREFKPLETFVVAFDGGASALKAVEYVVDQPLLKGMRCVLLYVGAGNAKIEAALAVASDQLQAAGYDVTIEQRAGEPEQVIEDVVAQDRIDLLVMGAYGHSPIRQLIVGSTDHRDDPLGQVASAALSLDHSAGWISTPWQVARMGRLNSLGRVLDSLADRWDRSLCCCRTSSRSSGGMWRTHQAPECPSSSCSTTATAVWLAVVFVLRGKAAETCLGSRTQFVASWP